MPSALFVRLSLIPMCALGMASAHTSSASTLQENVSVWDGVYTETQAARGAEIFRAKCSYCHRLDLSGGDGPMLKGAPFLLRYRGPLASLYFKIGNTMPQDNPASLEPSNVADLLAYILKSNDAPPGKTELPPDETLNRIAVTVTP